MAEWTKEKITPYNTGKIQIGLHYEPDTRPKQSDFDERLQKALLGQHDPFITEFFERYPRVAAAIIMLLMAFGLAILHALFVN